MNKGVYNVAERGSTKGIVTLNRAISEPRK